jgi:hypothetical protein
MVLLIGAVLGMSSVVLECTNLQSATAEEVAVHHATRDVIERVRREGPEQILSVFSAENCETPSATTLSPTGAALLCRP